MQYLITYFNAMEWKTAVTCQGAMIADEGVNVTFFAKEEWRVFYSATSMTCAVSMSRRPFLSQKFVEKFAFIRKPGDERIILQIATKEKCIRIRAHALQIVWV